MISEYKGGFLASRCLNFTTYSKSAQCFNKVIETDQDLCAVPSCVKVENIPGERIDLKPPKNGS